MFSDAYNLTEAVLSGRKTQTRRLITCPKTIKGQDVFGFNVYIRQSDGSIPFWPCTYDADEATIDGGEILPKYKVGEVVAVAQCYNGFYNDECDPRQFPSGAGWTNKMFVRADLMPHRIRITNVRVERLNGISETDCIKEGVELDNRYLEHTGRRAYCVRGLGYRRGIGCDNFSIPHEAYAALIDRICGKGTWESNPWVFVYDFELVKE